MMPEVMRDARHVVLDVPPVIGEIRVAATRPGGQQDVEPALTRIAAHPRMDRTIGNAINAQRPLEIIQKRTSERQHLTFEHLAFPRGLLDALPDAQDCRA